MSETHKEHKGIEPALAGLCVQPQARPLDNSSISWMLSGKAVEDWSNFLHSSGSVVCPVTLCSSGISDKSNLPYPKSLKVLNRAASDPFVA